MQNIWHKIKKILTYILIIIGVLFVLAVVGQFIYSGIQERSYQSSPGFSSGAPAQLASRNKTGIFEKLFEGREKPVDNISSRPSQTVSEGQLTQRKVIKNGALSLLVKKAEETAQRMQELAERLDGFVADARVYEVSQGTKAGQVTIRVPAGKFNEAVAEIKRLAVKVESETVSAQDVTEQFVDLQAQIKNLQAEEAQLLKIMERANTVQDTLQVAQQLSGVRGRIEQLQGQLQYLSRQVDMSTITVNLTAEADTKVFGIRWRPLFVIKQSVRDMFRGLADYIDAMIKLVFRLPVIFLWLATITVIILIVWQIIHWLYRRFFKPSPTLKV